MPAMDDLCAFFSEGFRPQRPGSMVRMTAHW